MGLVWEVLAWKTKQDESHPQVVRVSAGGLSDAPGHYLSRRPTGVLRISRQVLYVCTLKLHARSIFSIFVSTSRLTSHQRDGLCWL